MRYTLTFFGKKFSVHPAMFWVGMVGILFLIYAMIRGFFGLSALLFGSMMPAALFAVVVIRVTINSYSYSILPARILDSKPFTIFIRILSIISMVYYFGYM